MGQDAHFNLKTCRGNHDVVILLCLRSGGVSMGGEGRVLSTPLPNPYIY